MLGVAERLARHHRRCEELFGTVQQTAAAGDWPLLDTQVGTLREALIEHFHDEEERIFPLYEESSGETGSTGALCAQHNDIRALLWTLASYEAGSAPERFCADLVELRAAFDTHAEAEEGRMYPVFERLLGERLRQA